MMLDRRRMMFDSRRDILDMRMLLLLLFRDDDCMT